MKLSKNPQNESKRLKPVITCTLYSPFEAINDDIKGGGGGGSWGERRTLPS